jgi:hypothetical protein
MRAPTVRSTAHRFGLRWEVQAEGWRQITVRRRKRSFYLNPAGAAAAGTYSVFRGIWPKPRRPDYVSG